MADPAGKGRVLVLGNYRQTLTVIRSLGASGYAVIVGRTGRHAFTDYSHHTSEIWEHPDVRDRESDFVAALLAFLSRREDIALIFPVGDTQISCLARHLDQIAPHAAVAMPDPQTIAACQDKSRLYEINAEISTTGTDFRVVHDLVGMIAAAANVGFPCVVKPRDSSALLFAEKAVIVHDESELTHAIPCWPDEHRSLIVQKFASGYRHTCHFLADDGEVVCFFDYKVLRTDRANDTGYAVDTVAVEPTRGLREYCTALTQKLGYCGVGSAQFLVDDDTASVSFLEINPRLGAATAVPYCCGFDFPRMAAEYAVNGGAAVARWGTLTPTYPLRRAAWLMGDLEAIIREIKRGGLASPAVRQRLAGILRTLLAADFHLTWSWRDPLPTCFVYAQRLTRPLRPGGRFRNTSRAR